MILVYACVAPHGSEAIEQLATKSTVAKFQRTKEGLRKLAKEVGKAKPDTIVIASPHSLRLSKKIGIVTAENFSGTLYASPRSEKSVSLKVKGDVGFATALFEQATQKKLPVVGANYGTNEGATSDMPMDWGTLVPLWFIIP